GSEYPNNRMQRVPETVWNTALGQPESIQKALQKGTGNERLSSPRPRLCRRSTVHPGWHAGRRPAGPLARRGPGSAPRRALGAGPARDQRVRGSTDRLGAGGNPWTALRRAARPARGRRRWPRGDPRGRPGVGSMFHAIYARYGRPCAEACADFGAARALLAALRHSGAVIPIAVWDGTVLHNVGELDGG